MLKKFLIGTFVALALLLATGVSAAYDFGPTTLKVGSTGVFVTTLQSFVGAIADGSFGPMTKAKVMVWQAANGLTADGVFGPMSKAKANATVGTGTWPSGCSSNTGYSTTTGLSCSASTSYPAGCVSAVGYSSTTGAKCDGSTTGSTGALTGGAGTLDLTSSTTSVESKATENKADVKVLAFKAEAQDSDIALTNLKLSLKNLDYAVSSEKLTNYVDTVKVLMGSTVVGTADAADFTRESGSPDVYTKTMALSGAVVKEGDKNTFWVEVSSGSVDSEDLTAEWNIKASTLRYTDATGAILSDEVSADDSGTWTGVGADTFGYESSSANDLLTIKTSTSDPDASTIEVKTDSTTSDNLIGAFKLKVDTDSSDIKINEIPVIITFAGNEVANSANDTDWADSVISTLNVKVDGTNYEADLATADDATLDTGAGTATYRVDLTDSDVVIAAGDTIEVKVYADFGEQDSVYTSGMTVVASVAEDSIDAEGADELGTGDMSGSYTGELQTLSVDAVKVALVSDPTLVVSSAGTDSKAATYLAKFVFNVTAPTDKDIYLPNDSYSYGTAGAAGITYTVSNGADVTSATLSSTADKGDHTNYLINAGDTEKFTFSVYLTGDNTTDNVVITGIWYTLDHDVAFTDGSNTYEYTLVSGLTDFETGPVYLAE
jgi:hypothetical protein